MLTAIIVITSITQILISLFVLLRGRKNLSYFLFFLIGITTLGWALSNYLTTIYLDSPNVIYIVRIILFFVVLQNAFFCLFAKTFPSTSWKYSKKWLLIYIIFTLVTAIATLSPFVFTSAEVKDGLPVTKAGPAILFFIAHASFSIATAFRVLIKKLRASSGIHKNQLQILLLASFLNWVIVPITNFLITPLLKTTVFIAVSPLYTFAFAGMIAYAIVAQKLFDIKLIVARSVAYVSSIGLLVIGYATISGLLVDRVFSNLSGRPLGLTINTIIFLAAVLLYPHFKSFFDRTTNKLFYRDAYDSQEVLDKLASTIVAEIDLHRILNNTRAILSDAVKSTFVEFLLYKDEVPGFESRLTRYIDDDPAVLGQRLHEQKKDVVVSGELAVTSETRIWLTKNDIAVSLKLKTRHQIVGYILFGEKRSGNVYTNQDKVLLNIVANELAVAIQNSLRFEEIQGFAAILQARVDEATAQLRANNRKLKELDESKDEFISMASHQLRTPLTSVKGYLSMVLEGDAGKLTAMQRKLLTQSFLSSQRMVYLIADLLNVSRLKTGKFVLETKPTNLADVVQGELEQLTETAAGRNLELIYNKPASFPTLMLDETKIRQVIMNFIDNAIFYTPAGGHIEVRLKETGESVELTVNDNGMGVPKHEQHELFNKFYRAGNARKARPDGTGLGLFMAKKVIVAQGGSIIFTSTEGKGSTFGFTFGKSKLQVPSIKDQEAISND